MTSSHEHAHRDIHTRIGKDSEGWAAKSTLPFTLPGDNDHEMRLRLYTYNAGKHKGLVTRATVHHLKDGFETHALFSDYSAIVCQEPCTRATQKAVEAAHRAALSNLDNLVELARAYYANKREAA